MADNKTNKDVQQDKMIDKLKAEVQKNREMIDKQVREKPYQTLGIVVGVGFLAGIGIGLMVKSCRKNG